MLMAQIYQSATLVTIWLGEEDKFTSMAFEAIEKLSIGGLTRDKNWQAPSDSRQSDEISPASAFGWSDLSSEQVQAMERTFRDKPWWKRVWTVQECVLATEAVLICGTSSMGWGQIRYMMDAISINRTHILKKDLSFQAVSAIFPWFALQILKVGGPSGAPDGGPYRPQGFHSIVSWNGRTSYLRQCTDPRDFVYGILSLVEFRGNPIIPDYHKSVTSVFVEATRTLIREHRSLNAICLQSPTSPGQPKRFSWHSVGDHVSTWVLDLSIGRLCPIVGDIAAWESGKEVFDASGETVFDVDSTLSDCEDILRIQCIKWDVISHVCHAKYKQDDPMTGLYLNIQRIFELLDCLRTLNQNLYPTGEDMARVAYRTIRRDMMVFGPRPSQRQDAASIDRHKSGFENEYNSLFLPKGFRHDTMENGVATLVARIMEMDNEEFGDGELEFMPSLLDILNEHDKSFFITEKGYLGVIEGLAEKGDEIFIAYGACVPLLLRPAVEKFEGKQASIPEAGFHTLVAAAYVHGIMDGEVIDLVGAEKHDTVFSCLVGRAILIAICLVLPSICLRQLRPPPPARHEPKVQKAGRRQFRSTKVASVSQPMFLNQNTAVRKEKKSKGSVFIHQGVAMWSGNIHADIRPHDVPVPTDFSFNNCVSPDLT